MYHSTIIFIIFDALFQARLASQKHVLSWLGIFINNIRYVYQFSSWLDQEQSVVGMATNITGL